MYVFCRDVEMKAIKEFKIPKHVTDQNTLEILIEKTKKMDTEQQQTKSQIMIFILKLVLLFLLLRQKVSNILIQSNLYTINLMTQKKLDYSTEMIFSSL